jgi:hypothetical protein
MEAFEFLGLWWISPDQTNAVPGTLTFSDQEGIYLTLMGSFKSIPELQEFKVYHLILGNTQEGKYITLKERIEVQSQQGRSNAIYSTQRFRITSAYIGELFTDPEEIRFHKMEIQYSYLTQWANFPVLQKSLIRNEVSMARRASSPAHKLA